MSRIVAADRRPPIVLALALGLVAAFLVAAAPDAGAASSIFSLDFTGANPTTYDHNVGGGAYNDGTGSSVVESLEQQDVACGETVTYILEIAVDAGASAGDHQIEINFSFGVEGTNGNRAGHIYVREATINSGNVENGGGGGAGTFGPDSGHVDPGNDALVTSVSQVYDDAVNTAPVMDYAGVPADAEELLLTVQVDGLDASDTAILAVDVLTGCGAGSGTGNLQAQVDSATDITGGGSDAVQVGAETVPFKNFGAVESSSPAILIEKTPDLQVLAGGGVVEFTITVTNTGDVDLSDTAVTDPQFPSCARDAATVEGLLNGDGFAVGAVFSPGEWFSYTCANEVAGGLTNVAAASAMWEGQPVEDSDDAVVQVADVEITKTVVSDLPLIGGGIVTFRIRVHNIGEVTLRQTAVTDPEVAACARDAAAVRTTLNGHGNNVGWLFTPGETFTYECADEIAEGFTNVAEVSATVSGMEVSDSDSAEVDVVNPAIDIVKSPDDQSSDGLVFFTITVTNIGDVTLRQTVVEDAMFPLCARDAAAVRDLGSNQGAKVGWLLKPGETFSYTCGDEVAQSGTNEATARGWYNGVEFNDSDTADYTIT